MAIYLSSLPLVSTATKDECSAQNLKALGALTCVYLIIEEDGEAETQELFARVKRNQMRVILSYHGQIQGEDISLELERPTFVYALPEANNQEQQSGVAICTLPALVHHSSLPLKLRDHLVAKEQASKDGSNQREAEMNLWERSSSEYIWWQHPISLPFEVKFSLGFGQEPLSLGQIECVVVTSEDNEDNYFNYLEPTLYFFDFLISSHTKSDFTDDKLISYNELYQLLVKYCSEDVPQKRSLILSIAQKAPAILRRLEPKLRKSLLNTRKLLPVERVKELDGKCLEYLLRLEGNTLREKAQKNKMRILGLAKEESYNLLENRVLKDFLERCIVKSKQYLKEEEDFANQQKALSNRDNILTMQHFKQRCSELSHNAPLSLVHRQMTVPKPNFVLQKDHDYKQIWGMYLDLIREKRALDQSLICQQNLYQDVCELLVNVALCHLCGVTSSNIAVLRSAQFTLRALCSSNLYISSEQRNGHRIKLGSAAGPFLIEGHIEGHDCLSYCLEIVSLGSELTSTVHHIWRQLQKSSFSQLLATAPCYLMLTQVQTSKERNQAPHQVFIPIFTIHNLVELGAINEMHRALYAQLEQLGASTHSIIPYLLFSTLDQAEQSTHFTKLGNQDTLSAYLSPISFKPQQWLGSLAHIEYSLTAIINEVLNGSR
ncbi:MAG TPA: DUF2357 domain-containing protein [Candidatus Anaerobiospirillum stercoravium]|nr:DUF2357 domain-containing protein [Candidatus Anaerobiospirillum stercoravium]